jgi:hypothetical protein
MMFKAANRFAKGSGVYTCRCCSHNTRHTGGDGSSVGLCDTCYDLAGYDNMIQDGGDIRKADIENIISMVAFIKKRTPECKNWDDLLNEIIKICNKRISEGKE